MGDTPVPSTYIPFLDHPRDNFEMFVLEGDCDHEALARAADAAVAEDPAMSARLVVSGGPLRRRYSWRRDDARPEAVVVDLSHLGHTRPEYREVIDSIFHQRDVDLTKGCPTRIHVVAVDDDTTLLGIEAHHSQMAAISFFGLAKRIFAHYHRRVTGEDAPWAGVHSIHAQAGPERPTASRLEFLRYLRDFESRYPGARTARIAGTRCESRDSVMARFVVGDAETVGPLREAGRTVGASFGDLAIASAMSAIAEWNQRHGAAAEVLRASPVVGHDDNLSFVFVGARRGEFDDPLALAGSVARQRRAATEIGIDRRLFVMAERMRAATALRPIQALPLPGLGQSGGRSGLTFRATNPGVLWPEIVDGRPTGRSEIHDVGGLRVVDSVGELAVGEADAFGLVTWTMGGVAQLRLMATTAMITRAEIDELTDLIGRTLVALA